MSLAIEPFIAPSGDAAIGQLAQTLRRDLLTGLAAVERSVKTVQSDSESNVSGGVNLPDRSRRPNARYVVQGEVRRGGNGQVSVSLRMTDVLAGTQFWGEQYELPEQEASVESATKRRQIVRQLAATVTSAETRRVMTLPIDRLAAAELVLRGIAAEREDSPNSLMEARKLYDAALRLEPALVSAIARRVWSLVQESDERTSQLDYERIAPEVDRWSIRALNLDATDPMVWRVRSDALAVLGQRHAALEAQEHTIKLDPYRIDHYVNKAWLLLKLARPTEALGVIDHALTMNPVNAEGLLRMACEAYLLLERIDDAITTCEKAAGLSSDTTTVQLLLAAAYANRGDAVKAAAAKAELLKADPQFTMSRMLALQHNNAPEYRKLAEGSIYAGLRKAGIPE